MPAGIYDRAQMTVSGTPGTGTITLGSATSGYQTFAAAGAHDGETLKYLVQEGTAWELRYGVYTSAGTTLTRGVLIGSSTGSPISFTSAAIVTIVDISSVFAPALPNAQTTNYTVLASDFAGQVKFTGSSASTFTLPAASSVGPGFWFTGQHAGTGSTGANKKLTYAPASGTIDGVASFVTYPGDTRRIWSDGTNWFSTLIVGGYIEIVVADSPFTLSIPTGANWHRASILGGGGSGGGGRRGAASGARSGGTGGGGGACVQADFITADLGTSVTVTIAAIATGGSAASGNDQPGGNGNPGNNTTFGTLITAYGGGAGLGGGAANQSGGGGGGSTGAGGAGASAANAAGGAPAGTGGGFGGGGDTSGAAGTAGGMGGGAGGGNQTSSGTASAGGSSFLGGSGGGAGGGITAANAAQAGAAGGSGTGSSGSGGNGGNAGTSGVNGQGGGSTTAGPTALGAGTAGGGGGAGFDNTGGGAASAGGTGSNGGIACGGGGGGASLNGNASGAGGDGGTGLCRYRYGP